MTEIAFVAVYAHLLLDEWLAPSQVIGAALVIVGILSLFQRNKYNGQKAKPG